MHASKSNMNLTASSWLSQLLSPLCCYGWTFLHRINNLSSQLFNPTMILALYSTLEILERFQINESTLHLSVYTYSPLCPSRAGTRPNFPRQSMCSSPFGVPKIHVSISPAWICQEKEAMWLQERSSSDMTEKGSGHGRASPVVDGHPHLPPSPSMSRTGGPARAINPGWAC